MLRLKRRCTVSSPTRVRLLWLLRPLTRVLRLSSYLLSTWRILTALKIGFPIEFLVPQELAVKLVNGLFILLLHLLHLSLQLSNSSLFVNLARLALFKSEDLLFPQSQQVIQSPFFSLDLWECIFELLFMHWLVLFDLFYLVLKVLNVQPHLLLNSNVGPDVAFKLHYYLLVSFRRALSWSYRRTSCWS